MYEDLVNQIKKASNEDAKKVLAKEIKSEKRTIVNYINLALTILMVTLLIYAYENGEIKIVKMECEGEYIGHVEQGYAFWIENTSENVSILSRNKETDIEK